MINKLTRKLWLVTLLLCVMSVAAIAQDFPEKSGRLVNDFTNTLTQNEQDELERDLVAFDDSTSTQITVVMLKSVEDYDVSDYAMQLGRKWGVGQQGKNNGIVLLVAKGDRKVTIQTGYGVEGALPDAYAKRIIDEDITPNFREGNYYQGIREGVTQIEKYVKGEYKQDKPKVANARKGKGGMDMRLLLVIIIIIIWLLTRGGGGRGGRGQYIGSRGSGLTGFILGSLLSGGGRSSGGWGGSSSGGSSGGGFGGFGGGSFGGGGASGSW